MFNVGDRVRVLKGDFNVLVKGNIHTVTDIDEDGWVYVDNASPSGGWFHWRFEKVEENNMKDYPTELWVGDRLKTKTGREYVVTDVQGDAVTYAYIPAKYDNRSEKKIELDTRRLSDLNWVSEVVDAAGTGRWTKTPQYKEGQTVLFKGKSFTVDKVYGDFGQYVTLARSVHVSELDN